MIRQLQNSKFMREKVRMLVNLIDNARTWVTGPDARGIEENDDEAGEITETDVEEVVAGLRRLDGVGALWEPATDLWLPHDRDAAILQSSMDEYYRQNGSVVPDDSSVFGEMLSDDPLVLPHIAVPRPLNWDPRVIGALQAKGIRLARRWHRFPAFSGEAAPLDEKAKIILFGDWGSGIPNARAVSWQIWTSHVKPARDAKEQVHVIHLGDGYYAGFSREYPKRFTPFWPVPRNPMPTVLSWTLAGNHDMYSGGHGFFKMLKGDKRFANQRGCSHFLIENEHWQIFGLDTAYRPGDMWGLKGVLHQDQVNWLTKQRNRQKKCLLLTHHQPFSAYGRVARWWPDQLQSLLEESSITAWFWGHEHQCAVYQPHLNVTYPVLLGHGGFAEKPKNTMKNAPPMRFEWTDKIGDCLTFGFGALAFDCDQIDVRLIDMEGKEKYRFTIA
jgi:hypothetical protein